MTIHDLKKSLPIYRKKLKNGLETVILPIRKVPVVTISVGYKVGSKNEVRGKTGLAHLFEHLMFEGTANVPKGGFDQYCSIAGGTNNAYTTYDLTSYIMALPSHQLELGLWLESDRMFNFEIGEKALENQKKVVVEEINQTVENQPYGRWRNFLAENAFAQESSYSWEVQGFSDDVKTAGLKDINDFYKKFYQPENACLVIAGDIAPDRTMPRIEKYFDQQVKKQEIYRPPNKKEMLQGAKYAKFEDNVPFHAVFLAFHCSGFKDEEILAGDVLAFILGSGKSSILYNSLVYEKQTANSIGVFTDKREYSSLFTIYSIASDPSVTSEQLFSDIDKELKELSIKGIDEKKLVKARNQLSTQIAYELQYSSGIADITAGNTLFWEDPERIYTVADKYLRVTEKDVKNFIDKYINQANMVRIDAVPATEI